MKEAAAGNIQGEEEALDTYVIEIATVDSEDVQDTSAEVTRTCSSKHLSPYPEDMEKVDDDAYDDPEVGKVPYFQWAEVNYLSYILIFQINSFSSI